MSVSQNVLAHCMSRCLKLHHRIIIDNNNKNSEGGCTNVMIVSWNQMSWRSGCTDFSNSFVIGGSLN